MKKGFIWKLLLIIGLCPFIAPFFYYFLLHFAHNVYSWILTDMLTINTTGHILIPKRKRNAMKLCSLKKRKERFPWG